MNITMSKLHKPPLLPPPSLALLTRRLCSLQAVGPRTQGQAFYCEWYMNYI